MQVENNLQTLLVEGRVHGGHCGHRVSTEQRVEAAVGDVAWPLGKHLPALKAAQNIYSFLSTRAVYYCLILPPGKLNSSALATNANTVHHKAYSCVVFRFKSLSV